MDSVKCVSVVMATYNEPATIVEKAIRSILNQTYKDFELLIIDDSTKIETVTMINALALEDKRIIVIRQNERIGFVPALNIGLNMARGKYVSRMDGDDIALPEKLALQINFLDSHPLVDILGSAIFIINKDGISTSERTYPLSHSSIKLFTIFRSPFAHPTVVMRRTILDKNFRYDETLKRSEDIDLWLRLLNAGYQFANMPDKLLQYRVIGDLATKRTIDHFIYNRKVRAKNFSFRNLFFSCGSLFISYIYTITPKWVVSKMYSKENF